MQSITQQYSLCKTFIFGLKSIGINRKTISSSVLGGNRVWALRLLYQVCLELNIRHRRVLYCLSRLGQQLSNCTTHRAALQSHMTYGVLLLIDAGHFRVPFSELPYEWILFFLRVSESGCGNQFMKAKHTVVRGLFGNKRNRNWLKIQIEFQLQSPKKIWNAKFFVFTLVYS